MSNTSGKKPVQHDLMRFKPRWTIARPYVQLKPLKDGLERAQGAKQQCFASDLIPSEEDLFELQGRSSGDYGGKLLDRYERLDVVDALGRYGITEKLREIGYGNIEVLVAARQKDRQRVEVYYPCPGQDPILLGELVICTSEFSFTKVRSISLRSQRFHGMIIYWIRLQDPKSHFTSERPVLPGQTFPGLGVGKQVRQMVTGLAALNKFDLISNAPEFLHNAVMYHPEFLYVDPGKEGYFRALWRDLQQYGMAKASWAIYLGCVEHRDTNKRVEWFHEEQVKPLSAKLVKYFNGQSYRSKVQKAMLENSFELKRDRYEAFAPINPDGSPRNTTK